MKDIVISGVGHYVPTDTISNDELTSSFNSYAEKFNQENYEAIKAGYIVAMEKSDSSFIFKAAGIKKRHTINKSGVLDINTMHPLIKKRDNNEQSLQCEMAVKAAKIALKKANQTSDKIDAVIVACSNMERPYPAIAIEVQKELQIQGWGYDMNAACSSAVFGINMAVSSIKNNLAQSVLVIVPEIYTAHLNFCDRKSHFIFGDAAAAVVIELQQNCNSANPYRIIDGSLKTSFSNNIRNNFGFLNRCTQENTQNELLFTQNGKAVREEVVPLAAAHITGCINNLDIDVADIKRLWLHQSNSNMNINIARTVLGREPNILEVPSILEDYGNTGASSVLISFDNYNKDLKSGDLGVMCAFGAGYTAGCLVLQKV